MFHKDQLKAILGRKTLFWGASNGDYGCRRDFRSWLFYIDDNVRGCTGNGGRIWLISHSLYATVDALTKMCCVHLMFCVVICINKGHERERGRRKCGSTKVSTVRPMPVLSHEKSFASSCARSNFGSGLGLFCVTEACLPPPHRENHKWTIWSQGIRFNFTSRLH